MSIGRVIGGAGMIGGVLGATSGARTYLAKPKFYGAQRILALNDTSGTAATDYGTSAANGTYVGGYTLADTAGPGASMGNAVKLNGTSGYINFFNSTWGASFSLNTHTIMGWFKVASSSVWSDGQYRRLANLGNNGSNEGGVIKSNTTDTIYASAYHASTSYSVSSTLNTTAWFHIAKTISGGTMRLYINGVEVGTPATSMVSATGSLTAAAIGRYSLSSTQYWSGWACWFCTFNTALSAGDIADLAVAV